MRRQAVYTVPGSVQCPAQVVSEKKSYCIDLALSQLLNAFANLMYGGFPAPDQPVDGMGCVGL